MNQAKKKGGRKLNRGRIRRTKTLLQVARTARNKQNARLRIARRAKQNPCTKHRHASRMARMPERVAARAARERERQAMLEKIRAKQQLAALAV